MLHSRTSTLRVVLNGKLAAEERREALRRLRYPAAKLVGCLEMLGEEFDLPGLKFAVLHDS